MPGLATDLLKLVKDVTAFHQPILDSFDPPKLITDPLVLSRIAYNRLPQNTQKPLLISDISPQPFIVWKGPFAYDQGQTAIGSSGTKKALFWFKCFHASATEADNWTDCGTFNRRTGGYVLGYRGRKKRSRPIGRLRTP